MRIDPKISTPAITGSEPKPAAPREPARTSSGEAAIVELSVVAKPADEAGVTARIAKLKALVDAGEYAVDLDKLAEKIVEDDLLRLGGSGRSE